MTNDIRTRRLIVTLNDVSGEESDTVASDLETNIRRGLGLSARVEHALDDAPLVGISATASPGSSFTYIEQGKDVIELTSPEDVRKLAALLLRIAHDVEENYSTCRHCHRVILERNGHWIDPGATGDDAVWRGTCDSHDTFDAVHEPLGRA